MAGQAKEKAIVWEQPTTEFGNSYGDGFFNLCLDVTKVELKADETVVYVTAQQRSDDPDYSFLFAGDTYLKVGDQRYTITSADNIELNKFVRTDKDGRRDMAFHFPALPQGTKSFDLIEGDGERAFQIKGIKPVEERWKQLFPSYWRDNNGDWKIAFFEDCAIYDCKFWNYKQRDVNQKTGEAIILMTNGNDELKVMVGKDKKGQRPIQIGSDKKVYSMITTRFLPDYPTKDTREGFVDTGYKEDTITVVGWIKDMPEQFKQLKTFDFGYENIYKDEHQSVSADLDEQGRFIAKIPVLNSTEFFIDWELQGGATLLDGRRLPIAERTLQVPARLEVHTYGGWRQGFQQVYRFGRQPPEGAGCRHQPTLRGAPHALHPLQHIQEGQHADAASTRVRTVTFQRSQLPTP